MPVTWVNSEQQIALWNAAAEAEVGAIDLLVLLALGTFAHRQTRMCDPSVPGLAERALVDERTVRKAVARLAQAGLVEVEERKGRRTKYTVLPTPSKVVTPGKDDTPDNFVPDPSQIGESTPDTFVPQPLANLSPEQPSNHSSTSREQPVVVDRFDEFWSIYPKKVEKKKARVVFDRVVKKHDPAEIIAGARTYAAATAMSERRFIKNPDGWLTWERWTDETAPVTGPPRPQTQRDESVAFVASLMAESASQPQKEIS